MIAVGASTMNAGGCHDGREGADHGGGPRRGVVGNGRVRRGPSKRRMVPQDSCQVLTMVESVPTMFARVQNHGREGPHVRGGGLNNGRGQLLPWS